MYIVSGSVNLKGRGFLAEFLLRVSNTQGLIMLSNVFPEAAVADNVVSQAYIWPQEELGVTVEHDDLGEDEIPVIDLGKLNLQDVNHCQQICNQVRNACASWGFFQVVNHGINSQLVERVQAISKKFFKVPLERKERLECKLEGDRFLGYGFYVPEKVKTSRRFWSEGISLETSSKLSEFASILWPEDIDSQIEFCTTIEEYSKALKELGWKLVRLIVNSLGVYPDNYDKFLPKEPGFLRANHYPTCPDPSQTMGLAPHQDSYFLTILHQNTVGLQVLKDGRWVAVPAFQEAFAINAGDMLQAISNGIYKSALHRAMVNKDQDRYSIAYFVPAPDWDQIMPLPELVDFKHPVKYRPFTSEEYLEKRMIGRVTHALQCFAVQ